MENTKKKKKNKNGKNKSTQKLDPVYKSFFGMAPTDEFGSGYITNYWKAIMLLFPFAIYFFGLLDYRIVDWILFGLSMFFVFLFIVTIYGFNKDMGNNMNPFDFVTFQFINIICVTGHFAISFYFFHSLYPNSLSSSESSYELIDYFILSVGTITTAGSQIYPVATTTKLLSLAEMCIGIWFLVTIIPVAIGFQAERTRQFHVAKKKFTRELEKAIKEGRFKEVSPEEYFKEVSPEELNDDKMRDV